MALVSMVMVPRAQRRTPVTIPVAARPDTLSVAADAAFGRMRFAQAESALAVARTEIAKALSAEPAVVIDTPTALDVAARDSLEARITRMEAQLTRAEQAPLITSYKTLAELPELRGDNRVRTLLD